MKITTAVIPLAGKGTRFLPASKACAKELFPIVDKPALLLILEECLESGIKNVILILSEEKEGVKTFLTPDKKLEQWLVSQNRLSYLDEFNTITKKLKIKFIYHDAKHIGSGGTIYAAKSLVENKPFAVLYADDLNFTPKGKDPALKQLIDAYEKTNSMVIGCQEVSKEDISKYGSCKIVKKISKSLYKISDIIEKPKRGTEPSLIAGLARYIMPKGTFNYIEQQIKKSKQNVEINLTDTMSLLMKDGYPTHAVIMDSIRYDTGDKLGYLKATVEYGLRDENLGKDFKKYLKELKL